MIAEIMINRELSAAEFQLYISVILLEYCQVDEKSRAWDFFYKELKRGSFLLQSENDVNKWPWLFNMT